jgi:glycine cleavage system aminomethyltransferase T
MRAYRKLQYYSPCSSALVMDDFGGMIDDFVCRKAASRFMVVAPWQMMNDE